MTTGLQHVNDSGIFGTDCYGDEYIPALSGGTYKGHFIPGMVFICWGLWWALQVSSRYQRAEVMGQTAVALGWYDVSVPWLRTFEPLLKVFGPPLGILVELRLDHPKWLCAPDLVSTGPRRHAGSIERVSSK